MFFNRRLFARYCRDEGGAYTVLFAMTFGLLGLGMHVGLDALRVQNSSTGGEHIVDIACQKIASADPALFVTADGMTTALAAQMKSRGVIAGEVSSGELTIQKRLTDPNLVIPVSNNRLDPIASYADLRRFTFDVTYSGKMSQLHEAVKGKRSGDFSIQKSCKPVCTGMNNVIYSSPNAVGHWFKAGVLYVGQRMSGSKAIDRYDVAPFVDTYRNFMNDKDRAVITVMSTKGAIRYRRIIDPSQDLYFDNDSNTGPGEPRQRNVLRVDVNFGDQLFVQKMNADGSLPGMCGEASPAEDCVGSNCEPIIGVCDEKKEKCLTPAEQFNMSCTFPGYEFPYKKDVVYEDMPQIDFSRGRVLFEYPKNGQPGKLEFSYTSPTTKRLTSYSIALAPNYFPNNKETQTVTFAHGVQKTLTNEVASAYQFTARWRTAPRTFSRTHYLYHIASIWTFWTDGKEECITTASPIVFDTAELGRIITTRNEDGRATSAEPHFDILGNGTSLPVEWPIGKGQAWLVDNRDGRAVHDMSGRRLFGDLDGREHGYAKLAELDTSGTGILSGHDLDGLALWFDNGNALVEDGELRPLREIGITSIDTRGTWQTLDDGREVLRSTAVMNGRTIMTEDIFVIISGKAVPTKSTSFGSSE